MVPLRKTYVSFIQTARVSDRAVTHSWLVFPKLSAKPIGTVKWHSPWRRYCFFPDPNTLYDGACLGDIAGFCNKQTNLRKMERQAELLAPTSA